MDDGRSDAERVMLQVRLPKDLVKKIDHLGIDLDLFRAATVEHVLREGFTAMEAREENPR